MFSLFFSLSFSSCPDLTPYFHGKNFTLIIPPDGWQYFYASHPKENHPFRLWLKSPKPIQVAAEIIPFCPNETTSTFLETSGGNLWIEGQCLLRSHNRILAVGVYSKESQIVEVKLPEGPRMRYGTRKSLELAGIFLGLVSVALIFFCYYVLPGPKRKEE
jgi:hypothetical protein